MGKLIAMAQAMLPKVESLARTGLHGQRAHHTAMVLSTPMTRCQPSLHLGRFL